MCRWTLRILAPLALLAPLAGSAEAGVGDSSVGALSPFGRLSLVQTVQYGGDCWYDNGANGPGYYPCGDEWNNALGGGAAHRRPGDPAPSSPRSCRCPSPGAKPRLSRRAVPPPWRWRSSRFAESPRRRRDRYAWVCRRRIPRRRQFSSVSRRRRSPHRRASLARRCWRRDFPAPGGAFGAPHIGAPASPGIAGVGTFHAGGAFGSSAHRRAGLARRCWRRDFPCRRRVRSSAYRRPGLAGSCRRRVSWRWSGWSFPGRRHRTSLRRGAQSVVSRLLWRSLRASGLEKLSRPPTRPSDRTGPDRRAAAADRASSADGPLPRPCAWNIRT